MSGCRYACRRWGKVVATNCWRECSEFYLIALITMNGGTVASSVAQAEMSRGRG